MKMYVANCTRQATDFLYRVLEENFGGRTAPRMQRIDVGRQIQISGDLSPEQIDSIAEQHARYGMIRVSEIDRTRPFIGLCWDTSPIPVSKLVVAIAHNSEVLEERGKQLRQEAAVAVSNAIDENIRELGGPTTGMTAVELSAVEEKPGSGDHVPFAEGIRVTKEVGQPAPPPVASRRRRAG